MGTAGTLRFVASAASWLVLGCAADRTGLAGADAGIRMLDASTIDARDEAGTSERDAGEEDSEAESDAGVSDVGVDGSLDAGIEVDAGLDGGVDAGRGCGTLVPTRTGLVLHYHARFGVMTEAGEDGRPR